MKYHLIQKKTSNKKWNEYSYSMPERPDLKIYTTYHKKIILANWYVEGENKWRLEQINPFWDWMYFIPIISSIYVFFYHRKYKVYKDEICVGIADKVREKGKLIQRDRFIVNGNEYFIRQGNTLVIRPFKKYEWPIEKKDKSQVAILRTDDKEPIYTIEKKAEIELEILIFMTMMCDIGWFSDEDLGPVNPF